MMPYMQWPGEVSLDNLKAVTIDYFGFQSVDFRLTGSSVLRYRINNGWLEYKT